MGILEPCRTLAAQLTAAGVPATVDPRTLPVPGAIVTPEQSTPAGFPVDDIEISVTLVAPGPGNALALTELDRLDTLARPVIGPWPARLVGYEHPTTGDTLAAWQYTTTRSITRTETPQP